MSDIKGRIRTILPFTREEAARKKTGRPRPLDLSRRMDSDASSSEIGGESGGLGGGSRFGKFRTEASGAGGGGGGSPDKSQTSTLPRYYTPKQRKTEKPKVTEEQKREKRKNEAKYLFYINLGLFLLGWLFFWVPALVFVFDGSALIVSVLNYLRHGRNGSTYGMASGVMGLIHFVLLTAYVILATLMGMFGQYFAGGFFGPFWKIKGNDHA